MLGPAGSGKSTLCGMLQTHFSLKRKRCRVVNLDAAAEQQLSPTNRTCDTNHESSSIGISRSDGIGQYGDCVHTGGAAAGSRNSWPPYECDVDVRELISVQSVMEELGLGPNGALIYAYEFLEDNFEWLDEKLAEVICAAGCSGSGFGGDDELFLFDFSGQIELFTHNQALRTIAHKLQTASTLNFRLCTVYCIDVSFAHDRAKLIAASLNALMSMVHFELPHLNILTKCDLAIPATSHYCPGADAPPPLCLWQNIDEYSDYAESSDQSEKEEDKDNDYAGDEGAEVAVGDSCKREATVTDESMLCNVASRQPNCSRSRSQLPHGGLSGRYRKEKMWKQHIRSRQIRGNDGETPSISAEEFTEMLEEIVNLEPSEMLSQLNKFMPQKFKNLNAAFANILEEFNLISYVLLNPEDEESIMHVSNIIENILQFDENQEVREYPGT